MTEIYYMVWREYGASPRARHINRTAAINEAERLANLEKGAKFLVMRVEGECLVPITPKTFQEYEDIPF